MVCGGSLIEMHSTAELEIAGATAPGLGERLLLVEDDPATRYGLTELIRTWGFVADAASDGEEALRKVTSFRPGIIISDLAMPGINGLELVRRLQEQDRDITTIILTGQGSVETAVEAIKVGAYDYLTKPVDPQRLQILLEKVVERQQTLREVKVLRRQLRERGTFGPMIGHSPQMRKVYQVIEQAAPTGASVLISGESGTGKELVALTIHQLSPRAAMPYVPINCAAIPETLLESEIFGHEKGAFTGAVERRQGCFELAHRGTLFLDEFNARNGKAVKGVEQDALRLLEHYQWPGNIRELRNVIERATILASGEFIEARHLPPTLVAKGEETLPTLTIVPGTTVDEAERRLITLTLEHCRNNKTRAAEVLGISLKTLHNKLNRMKAEGVSN